MTLKYTSYDVTILDSDNNEIISTSSNISQHLVNITGNTIYIKCNDYHCKITLDNDYCFYNIRIYCPESDDGEFIINYDKELK